jgi:tol-pal system protein YbgF
VPGPLDAATSPPAIAVPPPPPQPGVAETDPMIAAVTGSGSGTAPGSIRTDEVPTVPTELRGSGYDDAVRAFVEQQYEDSIQYFRNFIHGNSTSAYADDAQYWIGEAYLRKGMYSNAIKEFNQVVLRYGSGDRAAPALLKLAQVFSKIGDQVDARLSLQKLVNRYPGTPEASEAHRMLQQMGG